MNNSIATTDSIYSMSHSTDDTISQFYLKQLNLSRLVQLGKQRDVAILDDNGKFQVGFLLTRIMRNVEHHSGSKFYGVIVRLRDGRYTAARNYWDPQNHSAFYEEQIRAINSTHTTKHEPKRRSIHHHDPISGSYVTMEVTQLTPIAKVQNYPDKGSENFIKGVIVRFGGVGKSAYYLAISSDVFVESPQSKSIKKKSFLIQIENSQNRCPDFVPTNRNILVRVTLPDYKDLGVAVQPCNGPNNPRGQPATFENVTQCTPMCLVSNKSKTGQKIEKFYGAIVQLGNSYRAVPESEFMVEKVQCWARHGVQATSQLCLARRLTGTIQLYGGDIGHKLISWSDKRQEWEWVPLWRIGEDVLDFTYTTRKRSAPVRLSEMQHEKHTPCKHHKKSNTHEEKYMEILREHNSFSKEPETVEEGPKVAQLPQVKDIIQKTNTAHNAYKEEQKKLGKKTPTLDNATLDLSIMFEIIKGNVKGSLGEEINKALGIKPEEKQDCHLYMNAIQSTVMNSAGNSLDTVEMGKKGPRQKNKKVCSKEGCTTKVHTAMSKHGTCWKHCPDNEMKISIIAKRKVYSKEKKELQQTLPMCTSCGCRRVPNWNNKHCCVCKKAK
jgi:hypothetical protein